MGERAWERELGRESSCGERTQESDLRTETLGERAKERELGRQSLRERD